MNRVFVLLYCFCVISVSNLAAQNLCPNPNFEEYNYCPTNLSDFSVSQWNGIVTTSDYYNVCTSGNTSIPNNILGNQNSLYGDAYVGLVIYEQGTGWREYAQATFAEPLAAGCYEITLYYSNADLASLANGLGVYLSVGTPNSYIGLEPQVEVETAIDNYEEWFEISAEYNTQGGETHVTFGNFRTDANTQFVQRNVSYSNIGYVYVDSISVEYSGVPGALNIDLGSDVTLCPDEFPYTIQSGYPSGVINWSTGETGTSLEVNGPGVYSVEVIDDCEQGTDEIVVSVYEEPTISVEPVIEICQGSSTIIDLDASLGDYQWSDGTLGSSIEIDETGSYAVTLTYICGVVEEVFDVVQIPSIDLPLIEDIVVCENELPVVIDLSDFIDPFNSFSWSDGSSGAGLIVFEEGDYDVEVVNPCFSDFESFSIDIEPELPSFIPFSDNTACEGEQVIILAPDIEAEYEWPDGSANSFYLADGPGIYQLTLSNSCGTESYDFEITEPPLETINLGEDISICPGDSVLLSDDPQLIYDWSTGETETSIWAQGAGTYIASFQGACEIVSDTIVITENGSAPMLTLLDTITLCEGDSIYIESTEQADGVIFEWNTGSDLSGISITEGGVYSVQASNSCGVAEDSIIVLLGEPRPMISLVDQDSICFGETLVYELDSEGSEVLWNDGSSLDSFVVGTAGIYWVELTNGCGSTRDSFTVTELPLPQKPDLGDDVSICQGDSILLSSTVVYDQNTWANGTQGVSQMVYETGIYILEGSNSCGVMSDTIEVFDLGLGPNVSLGFDQQICNGDSVLLTAVGSFDNITWSSGEATSQLVVDQAGTYIVTVTNQCGISQDTVIIEQTDEVPDVNLGPDQILCQGDSLLLTPDNVSGTIEWSTGALQNELWIDEGGWYGVSLISSCGTSEDSVWVEEIQALPSVDLGPDTLICFVDNWEYDLDLPSDFEGEIQWSNGTTEETVSYFIAGTIWVTISNSCSTVTDTIQVDYVPSIESWSLPNDTLLCDVNGFLLGPDVNHSDVFYIWNTDDTTQEILVTEPGTYSLEISNECGTTFDAINVLLGESPSPFSFLETDTICSGEELILTEDQGASFDYVWQDGSDETSYEIMTSGTYSLSISNACGLEFSNSTIVVLPNEDFEIEIEDEYVDCEGEEILVDLVQQVGTAIEWFDGSTDWSNSFIESGLYSLSLYNECRDTIIDLLVRFEDCDQSIDIYIPNTFTPDEDGVNDFFTIYHPDNREILSSKISIYNRWGEQMFYSEDIDFEWYGDFKGRNVQGGVYVYIYEVEFIDGDETISRTVMGDLTVLR